MFMKKGMLPVLLVILVAGMASGATFSFTTGPTFTPSGDVNTAAGVDDGAINQATNFLETTPPPANFTLAPGNSTGVLIRSWQILEPNNGLGGPDIGSNEANSVGLTISFQISDVDGVVGTYTFTPNVVIDSNNDSATVNFATPFTSFAFDDYGTSRTLYSRLSSTADGFGNAVAWTNFHETDSFYAFFVMESPEPSTYAMMGGGLLSLALIAYRRRRKSA